jgi:ABC-type glycerol-3-phosphate transport system substrate-binding protein
MGCSPHNESPDGKIHLKYWAVWSGFELATMQSMVHQFNQSQDQIVVDLLSISRIERKLLVATAGGNPPDLASLSNEFLPYFAQKNAVIPLDGYLEAYGIRQEDFIPVFWEATHYDGYLWGLPVMGSAIALHYNIAHFREAGLDPLKPPITLDELKAVEERINILKGDQYERLAFIPSVSVPDWWPYCWVWFFGGDLWNGTDQLTLTAQACVEAFEWVRSYPTRLGVERVQSIRTDFGNHFASPQNPFLDGRLSMVLQGSWMTNFVEKYAPRMDMGAAPMCVKTADLYGTTMVESDVMYIPKGARHPRASLEFIRYLLKPENNGKLCLGFRSISPLKNRSSGYLQQHPNPHIKMFDKMVMGTKAHTAPKLSMWYEMLDEMAVVTDQVWLQRQTPLEALTEAQERLQVRLTQEIDSWNLVKAVRHAEWDAFIAATRQGVSP